MASEPLSVEFNGLDKLAATVGDIGLLGKPTRRLFNAGTNAILRRARPKAPSDRGQLRNSLVAEVDKRPMPRWGVVGSNVKHARPQEFGTGLLSESGQGMAAPHFPPPAALDLWAQRHGLPNGFVVARAIARRGGLRPKRFLRSSFSEVISKEWGRLTRRWWNEVQREWSRR
tara:strand:+ start:1144 stop:1659 length:516 start_codon:yes stop_codon:yes gene_type:complete